MYILMYYYHELKIYCFGQFLLQIPCDVFIAFYVIRGILNICLITNNVSKLR